MTSVAHSEREALCDLFVEVGPDAPTLCGDWTTRDLAAHLVVRDRNLLGGAGIVVPALSGFTDKGMAREETRSWDELIGRVRTGPLWYVLLSDAAINTIEYFVHHEDVRRGGQGGAGAGEPRTDIDDLERDLWARLGRTGRFLTRHVPRGIGVELVTPDGELHHVRRGEPVVDLVGPPGEIVLYLFGRKAVARVEVEGDDDAVAALRGTDFGV